MCIGQLLEVGYAGRSLTSISARLHLCVQQILDKEQYTLEELLDEDDLIQECKSLNGRLISL